MREVALLFTKSMGSSADLALISVIRSHEITLIYPKRKHARPIHPSMHVKLSYYYDLHSKYMQHGSIHILALKTPALWDGSASANAALEHVDRV